MALDLEKIRKEWHDDVLEHDIPEDEIIKDVNDLHYQLGINDPYRLRRFKVVKLKDQIFSIMEKITIDWFPDSQVAMTYDHLYPKLEYILFNILDEELLKFTLIGFFITSHEEKIPSSDPSHTLFKLSQIERLSNQLIDLLKD